MNIHHHVCVWLLVLLVDFQLCESIDMFGLINTLYYKADKNMDGIVTEPEMNDVYQGFDSNGDSQVSPAEFTPFWKEFSGQSQEVALAYFHLADIDGNGVITDSDIQPTYIIFDLNGDGQVQAQEFNLKWQEIYREVPFAVLFRRADKNQDGVLEVAEYQRLFSSLDSNADGSVGSAAMVTAWQSSGFGRDVDAQALVNAMDTDPDDVITTREVGSVLGQYDISGDHKIQTIEVIELVKLLPPLQ